MSLASRVTCLPIHRMSRGIMIWNKRASASHTSCPNVSIAWASPEADTHSVCQASPTLPNRADSQPNTPRTKSRTHDATGSPTLVTPQCHMRSIQPNTLQVPYLIDVVYGCVYSRLNQIGVIAVCWDVDLATGARSRTRVDLVSDYPYGLKSWPGVAYLSLLHLAYNMPHVSHRRTPI